MLEGFFTYTPTSLQESYGAIKLENHLFHPINSPSLHRQSMKVFSFLNIISYLNNQLIFMQFHAQLVASIQGTDDDRIEKLLK